MCSTEFIRYDVICLQLITIHFFVSIKKRKYNSFGAANLLYLEDIVSFKPSYTFFHRHFFLKYTLNTAFVLTNK